MRRALLFTLFLAGVVLAEEPAKPKSDREALVGTWKVLVYQDDGSDRLARLGVTPAPKGKEPRVAKVVFTADECWVLKGDGKRDLLAGLTNTAWKSITLDPTTSPQNASIVSLGSGDKAGKTYLGIYKIEDNKLTICWAETADVRPTAFESDAHNNLFICERISTTPEKGKE